MKIPVLRGVIDRRILVNYRAAPEVVSARLPPPFRPRLHHGYAIVGICLIRLRGVRPRWVPSWAGISSENAAHRIAVEWDEGDRACEGVYVARRNTSSRLSVFAGGRLFPGSYAHAAFRCSETDTHFEVSLRSDDGETNLAIVGDVAPEMPRTSIFASLDEASAFFEGGSLGYSATPESARFHGLELRCNTWRVEPLAVSEVRSSLFDDHAQFPPGSIDFDCALLMREVEHEWLGKPDMCCASEAAPRAAPLTPAIDRVA